MADGKPFTWDRKEDEEKIATLKDLISMVFRV